ncbi:TPA: hypothetical protein ACKPYM_000787 [Stenotrophomonas maltophilia]
MNIKIKPTALTLAITLCLCTTLQPEPAEAGAIVGATEFTQIANNIELVMQYAKQVEGVAQQVKQYKKQVEALRKLDSRKLGDLMLAGAKGVRAGQDVLGHIKAIDELDGVLSSVGKSIDKVAGEGRIASDTMSILSRAGYKISPNDYVGMMKALGKVKRDTYGKRMDELNKAATDASNDIERMNKIVALAPEIATNVEGLGALVQGNGIMVSQLAGLKQTMASSAAMNVETASLLAEQVNRARTGDVKLKEWGDEWLTPKGDH